MTLVKAQHSNVVNIRGFIGEAEREEILRVIRSCNLESYTSNDKEDINEFGEAIHTTMYLQTGNIFGAKLDWLKQKITRLVVKINQRESWGFNLTCRNTFNVRVAEYHNMRKGGSLPDIQHYDIGSIITVDIMLQEATQGGKFVTLESTAQRKSSLKKVPGLPPALKGCLLKPHDFAVGDILVFVSHKFHCVSEVQEGTRKVLVIEFWNGQQRQCGHRCDRRFGRCRFVDTPTYQDHVR